MYVVLLYCWASECGRAHSHCGVHRALGLALGLVVLLDALDHGLGHAHQALQLEGGALEGGQFLELGYCLGVGGVVLEEATRNEVVTLRFVFVDTLSYLINKPKFLPYGQILGCCVDVAMHVLGNGHLVWIVLASAGSYMYMIM